MVQSSFRTGIMVLACLVLGGVLFGLGYWRGERHGNNAPPGSDLARFRAEQASPKIPIPKNATPEMKEFLENQATLADRMNQLREESPTSTLTPQMFALFREENADILKRQSELSAIIAQQEAKNTPVAPPPLKMPANVSPQMQSYLILRDQLMRDQIAVMNQHRNDTLAAQQAAMSQWRQQNAARIQQLQQLANQALVQSAPTATPTVH